MQRRTKSLLDELDNLYSDSSDAKLVIESRANNVLASAINLLEQIDQCFPPDQAENLCRKFLNAIRTRDIDRFSRTVRKSDANT
jgi:hypothetical protein